MPVGNKAAVRILAIMALLISALISAMAVGTPSGAAPYVTNPTAKVNTTTPPEGGRITVSGGGFAASSALTITLDNGAVLGTTTADASGAYSLSGALPNGVTGTHTITVTDAAGNTATVTITIGAAASASSGPSGGSGGGGTGSGGSSGSGGVSNTGVAVMSIGGIGMLLLLGGAALVLAGKRRRATA